MAGIKVPPATRVLIARLEPNQVGREFPLSAEKLSPILAFYSAPNIAAGIALCRRLLEFGGLGHTCSIHSQNRAAILEFGSAMPAFRVIVNSASVHGSIGYSTNLFPAMTLGCGAPGGNITSDNIGPRHLMNIKRIAWESRGIEHRTIPADQRMSGATTLNPPEAAQAGQLTNVRQSESVSTDHEVLSKGAQKEALATPRPGLTDATNVTAQAQHQSPSVAPGVEDRATIAQVVENVMAAHGIARGSGAAKFFEPAKELPSPSAVAAEIADRLFGSPSKPRAEPAPNLAAAASSAAKVEAPVPPVPTPRPEIPAKPVIEISPFVSENDVRRAMTRGEKIFIGPKTILTPSARDLGLEHEVFVETQAGSLR